MATLYIKILKPGRIDDLTLEENYINREVTMLSGHIHHIRDEFEWAMEVKVGSDKFWVGSNDRQIWHVIESTL